MNYDTKKIDKIKLLRKDFKNLKLINKVNYMPRFIMIMIFNKAKMKSY